MSDTGSAEPLVSMPGSWCKFNYDMIVKLLYGCQLITYYITPSMTYFNLSLQGLIGVMGGGGEGGGPYYSFF